MKACSMHETRESSMQSWKHEHIPCNTKMNILCNYAIVQNAHFYTRLANPTHATTKCICNATTKCKFYANVANACSMKHWKMHILCNNESIIIKPDFENNFWFTTRKSCHMLKRIYLVYVDERWPSRTGNAIMSFREDALNQTLNNPCTSWNLRRQNRARDAGETCGNLPATRGSRRPPSGHQCAPADHRW